MKLCILLVLLQLLYIKKSIQRSSGVLKVSIYYESLCPYSVTFIKNDFYPAYQKINSSLLVDFIPYGNARQRKVDGKWKFSCQHGRKECWGNKAQACGLAAGKEQNKNVEYIKCMMDHNNRGSEEAVINCAHTLGVSATSIVECTEGVQGDELHAKYGDRTHTVEQVGELGVPLIIFNDIYDEELDSQTDFLKTCCSLLPNNTESCNQTFNAVDPPKK